MTLTRRGFVKGCIYASAAGLAAAGAEALVGTVATRSRFRRVDYLGATVVGGPAPQGVPLMPLRADERGDLWVNAVPEGVEGGVLDWYKYCGHTATPGLQAAFAPRDEFVRYFLAEEKKATIVDGWYLPKLGQVASARDFAEVGKGAAFHWRSQGMAGKDIITGIVLKVEAEGLEFAPGVDAELVRREFLVPAGQGAVLLAYSSFCKHFCCVPGWRESPLAPAYKAEDKMYCTCHHSVYDPLRIRADFYLLQEEDEAVSVADVLGG